MSTDPTPLPTHRYFPVAPGPFSMFYACIRCGALVDGGSATAHDGFHAVLDQLASNERLREDYEAATPAEPVPPLPNALESEAT
jgi:hypothetical protein